MRLLSLFCRFLISIVSNFFAIFGTHFFFSTITCIHASTADRDSERLGVAILLFDDVEVLDFAGPFEVFSVTAELNGYKHLHVFTLAEEPRSITTRNGLTVRPAHTLDDAPKPDIIVIPGGIEAPKQTMMRACHYRMAQDARNNAEVVMSVCTGARILTKAGLLDGLTATTHHEALLDMRELCAKYNVGRRRLARYTLCRERSDYHIRWYF